MNKIINIIGLSLALSACLIILFYVQSESSWDRHWQDAERIYRLNTNFDLPGRAPYRLSRTSSLLLPALEAYFPAEVEVAARAWSVDLRYVLDNEARTGVAVAVDPGFSRLFGLRAVQGNLEAALASSTDIALSEEMALSLFGTTAVLNRVLGLEYGNGTVDYRIGAVYALETAASILELPALIRLDESRDTRLFGTWNQAPVASYVKLAAGASAESVRVQLNAFADQNIDISAMSPGPDTLPHERLSYDMSLLSDLHLDANFENIPSAGSRSTVQAFSLIAALIVLVACTNFAFLTLAQSGKLAPEVGLRKVLGASSAQLLQRYLKEAGVVVGLALLLGLMLTELALPLISALLETPLDIHYGKWTTWGNIAGLYLFMAVVGGLYPALVLARFKPLTVLNRLAAPQGSVPAILKHVLLIFQFAVAIALIIATGVIYLQVEFVSRRDPGFRQEEQIIISNLQARPEVSLRRESLREQVLRLPQVSSATLSSYHPLSDTAFARLSSAHRLQGRADESFILANTMVDEHFFATYEMDFVAGRGFSPEQDRTALSGVPDISEADVSPRTAVLNEAAVRFLGFAEPADALGQLILDRSPFPGRDFSYEIVGVVADNQFYSLRSAPRPQIYFYHPAFTDVLTVTYEGSGSAVMENLATLWNSQFSGLEFSASYLEPLVEQEFSRERREGQLFVIFALFAALIAALGLYGIALLSVNRRTREIGIRKVLGAELRELLGMLLWQFSKPVLLANVIAWPLTLWIMLKWLQGFPYQIDTLLLLPLCALAAAVALMLAWLTIAGNTLKVATTKPVLALRYE